MSYVKCNVCPTRADCEEAAMCLNTLVTHKYHTTLMSSGAKVVQAVPHPGPQAALIARPVPAQLPAGIRGAVRDPRPPATGSVKAAVDNACEAQLAGHDVTPANVKLAAAAALVALLAAGVNENSAKKGVGLWARARLQAT